MKYLLSLGIALLCASVASAVEIRKVAFSRDPAPIATTAVTELLLGGLSGPVISEQGHIAFIGAIYEKFPFAPAQVKGGLFRYSPSEGLALVASSLEDGPTAGPLPDFNEFPWPDIVVNGQGEVSLREASNFNSFDDEGIWKETPAGLQLIAREGSPVPGFLDLSFASDSTVRLFSAPALGKSGQVLFRATARTQDFSDVFNGIWRAAASGELELLARTGIVAPGAADAARFISFGAPLISGSGRTAFTATLQPDGGSTFDQSVWREDVAGDLQLIGRSGQPAPDRTGGASFGSFGSPQFLADGHIAFSGSLTGPNIDAGNDIAVWRKADAGGVELVAQEGHAVSTAAGHLTLRSPLIPTIFDGGRIGLSASLGDVGSPADGNAILRENDGGVLQLLVRSGDAPPGSEAGTRFEWVGSRLGLPPPRGFPGADLFSFNSQGQVAFFGRLAGDSIDPTNNEGIWATDANGDLQKIVRRGDTLDLDNGPGEDRRIVRDVRFIEGFTDNGELAFVGVFENPLGVDQVGIIYVRVNAVPEPSGLVLAGIALAGAMNLARRRRSIVAASVVACTFIIAGTASAVPVYNIVPLGLDDLEHTGTAGHKYSVGFELNEAGQVSGYSERYNGGSTALGRSTWLYDGATTINVGLIGPEYTASDGSKSSNPDLLNEAGQVSGYSYRYNGGSAEMGQSTWLYNGVTTIDIGLTGAEHTRNDGYKFAFLDELNEAGQVSGRSHRFNGLSVNRGQSAWLYNGATTVNIGLIGPEHTRSDGVKDSRAAQLNEAGQVSGSSRRYNGGPAELGRSVWLYDGSTTIDVGLTGNEHTATNGLKWSEGGQLNESGQVIGRSMRFNSGFGWSAWLYDGATTLDIGLTGAEHTSDSARKDSGASFLNEAGQVSGYSYRYNGGSVDLGLSAWRYDGATTVDIGLVGGEHTRSDGYKSSESRQLNEAGQVRGQSARYNGGSTHLGYSAWLFNGTTTIDIGLTGSEHTSNDGYKSSFATVLTLDRMNEAGQVIGTSARFHGGSTSLGGSAWLFNGTTTIDIGLTGSEHTRNDGYKESQVSQLNEAGQVRGYSYRYNGGSTQLGQDAWVYDPVLDQTFAINLSTRSDGYADSFVSYLGEDGLALGTYDLFDASDNDLGRRAFSFTVADGLHDLGSLVEGGLPANGWDYLADAIRANSLGQILGQQGQLTSGGQMSFLLTPVPEPSALVMMAIVTLFGAMLIGHRRRSIVAACVVACIFTVGGTALAVPTYNIVRVGLDDLEHTRNDGYKYSLAQQLSEAGKVLGYSKRYNGDGTDLGYSAWLYNGTSSIAIGLTDSVHTRSDGYKYNAAERLNEEGHVVGYSERYSGGTSLGRSAWLYDGVTTIDIGLVDSEHTYIDGYKWSEAFDLNEAGQVFGNSMRFTGFTESVGQSAWLFDGVSTVNIGLVGSEHTDSNGYKFSGAQKLNEAGQVIGYAERYNEGSTLLGYSAWLYDGASTIDIGLTGPEYTSGDGVRSSLANELNEAGQVSGTSSRYNGGSTLLGNTAWLYHGGSRVEIGLIDDSSGYQFNSPRGLNEAGQVTGSSLRYNGGGTQLGRSAWFYDGSNTVRVGIYGAEHTRNDGYQESEINPLALNEAGRFSGNSLRYNGGSTELGRSAWLYDGTATVQVGLTGFDHTRDDGYKESFADRPNEAGQVVGYSARYNGGSTSKGVSAWLYNGATTVHIGLTGPEHTRNDGYNESFAIGLNESGQVIGKSDRYNGGSTAKGESIWFYNGTTTINIGLVGPEHTTSSGYKISFAGDMNEVGQVIGRSYRYNGGSGPGPIFGWDAWFYDSVLDQTFSLTSSTRSDGLAYSRAYYLGEDGLVLGGHTLFDALDNGVESAFYFTIADGFHDLGPLVAGGLAANGWDYLADAIRANGPGQILGYGKLTSQSGGQMAYLLTPVPEPSGLVLAGMALAGAMCIARRRCTIIAAWAVAGFAVAPLVGSAASVRTVAWSGEHAPGTAEGVFFDLDRPFETTRVSLNSSGQVAFFATLAGSGVDATNDIGVWSEDSGALELVARTGNAAPGIDGATLARFRADRVGYLIPTVEFSDSGDIAFGAELAGADVDSTNNQGFWAGHSGSLRLVARSGFAPPGLPDGYESVDLSESSYGPPVLNSVGEAAFVSTLVGDEAPSAIGLWTEDVGMLELIAGPAAQAPGFPPGASLGGRVTGPRDARLFDPTFNSAGQTAFAASVFASADSQTRLGGGIFLEENGTLSAVVREGDPILGVPDGVSFRVNRVTIELELNSVGQVAFVSSLTGSGVNSSNSTGIFSNGSGAPTLVAREGDQAPGAPPGVIFQDLQGCCGDWLTFNSAGQTAFVAQLGGVGVDDGNDMSYWSEGFGSLHLVAREGARAPGTSEGTYFGFVASPCCNTGESFAQNSAGHLAFTAGLSGPDVDATNGGGLWAEDRAGNLRLVIRYGDQLEVAPGDFRTINGLSFLTRIEEQGQSSFRRNGTGFNDRGQLAFWASFTDGSDGIFVSNLVAVPEPSALLLLTVGGCLFLTAMRRSGLKQMYDRRSISVAIRR